MGEDEINLKDATIYLDGKEIGNVQEFTAIKVVEISRGLTEIHPNIKREFSGTCKVTINNKEFNKLIKKGSVNMEIAKEMLKGKKIAEVIKEWKKAEYVYAFRNSFRRVLLSKKEEAGNE